LRRDLHRDVAEATPETARRALLKSVEVCDLVRVQPYVLRSWEKEFPDLGVARSAGGPRLYRRSDVDRVVRIKQLVFGEGLTIAGVRRRLDEERAQQEPDEDLPFDDEPRPPVSAEARAQLDGVKAQMRALLEMLQRPRPRNGNGHAPAHGSVEAAREEPEDTLLPIETVPVPVAAQAASKSGRKRSTKSRAS
jgi:DNA-binding transcriptional MerR regulator